LVGVIRATGGADGTELAGGTVISAEFFLFFMSMSASKHLDDVSLADALAALARAGARVFCVLPGEESLSLVNAAKRIGVSTDWMRDHLAEFPNAYRLPAGERIVNGEGRNVGELRVPSRDIEAFQARHRLHRMEVPA